MKTLDRFLKPLFEKRADELHLYADVPPTYLLNGKPVRELGQLFNNEEILSLLQEILTVKELQELETKRRLNHEHHTENAKYRCQVRWTDGDLKIRFTFLGPLESATTLSSPSAQGPVPSTSPLSAAPQQNKFPPPPAALTPPPQGAAPQTAVPPTQPPATPQSQGYAPSVAPQIPAQQPSNFAAPSVDPLQSILNDPLRSTQERAIISALNSTSAPKELDRLFKLLLQEKGSDLHISSGEKPIIRVDGQLRRLEHLPVLSAEQIAQLIAPIMPERNRIEFPQTWDTDFAYEVEGVGRFRSNIFMDRKGIGAVFRLIPSKVVTAEQLGLPKALTDLCYLSKGLVLVTGPTGSGKSTTLCALIDLINRTRDDHIITIEDPIEFVHPNKRCLVNQREVGVHTNSFKSALRAALREDPDIILVGEMRDLETVAIAIETAETGHLVFGTLHTTSATSTVDRIIDQFPGDQQEQIRMMVANSLKAVISQTLLRKKGGGRIAAMEILLVTHGAANLIREKKLHQLPTIMQTSRAMGMQLLNDVLLEYVLRDIVDIKEAYMKSIDKLGFLEMLEEAGVSTAVITQQTATGDQILE